MSPLLLLLLTPVLTAYIRGYDANFRPKTAPLTCDPLTNCYQLICLLTSQFSYTGMVIYDYHSECEAPAIEAPAVLSVFGVDANFNVIKGSIATCVGNRNCTRTICYTWVLYSASTVMMIGGC